VPCLLQPARGDSTTKWFQEPQAKAIELSKVYPNTNKVTCQGLASKERHQCQIRNGLARAKQAGIDGARTTRVRRYSREEACWEAEEDEVASMP
jgi:hypothetical protein